MAAGGLGVPTTVAAGPGPVNTLAILGIISFYFYSFKVTSEFCAKETVLLIGITFFYYSTFYYGTLVVAISLFVTYSFYDCEFFLAANLGCGGCACWPTG